MAQNGHNLSNNVLMFSYNLPCWSPTPTPLNKKMLPSQKTLEVSYVMRPYAEKRV